MFQPIITTIPNSDLQTNNPYGYSSTLATGQLGIPVISWIDFFDNSGNKLLTIAECLITVKQGTNLVKTYSSGKDYSVKTYIGRKDFDITIEGYLFNVNADGTSAASSIGIYPADRMNSLQSIIANQGVNLGINIFSPYLELFGDYVGNYVTGIDYIVINSCDFAQEEGMYSQQKFTLQCVSDSINDSAILYSPYYI